MLASAGLLPDLGECWHDAQEQRLHLGVYELVRHTRPGATRPAWSWRYEKSHYEGLRESLIREIRRKGDRRLTSLISQVSRTPGFAPARAQVKSLYQLVRAEWKRSRGQEPAPELPRLVPWLRKISDAGIPLRSLIKYTEAEQDAAVEAAIKRLAVEVKHGYPHDRKETTIWQ